MALNLTNGEIFKSIGLTLVTTAFVTAAQLVTLAIEHPETTAHQAGQVAPKYAGVGMATGLLLSAAAVSLNRRDKWKKDRKALMKKQLEERLRPKKPALAATPEVALKAKPAPVAAPQANAAPENPTLEKTAEAQPVSQPTRSDKKFDIYRDGQEPTL